MADYYMSDSDAPSEEKEESKGTKTALLPLAFFAGKTLNPGDTLPALKIVKVGDDQIEVELDGEPEEEVEEETIPAPQGGMEEMMG